MVLKAVTTPDQVDSSFKSRELYRTKFETYTLEVVTISEGDKKNKHKSGGRRPALGQLLFSSEAQSIPGHLAK
jgi:hypothetical protein